jgi:hypothetical protein
LNNEVPVHPNKIEPKQGEMKGYVVHEPAAKYRTASHVAKAPEGHSKTTIGRLSPEGMVEQQDHRDGS